MRLCQSWRLRKMAAQVPTNGLNIDKGLSFPATVAAQSGGNVLDEYEEGTVSGLPFATASDGDATADSVLRAKMFGFVQRTDVQDQSITYWSVDSVGGTEIFLRYMGDNASTGQVQGVAATGVTPNFTISGFYFTDS
jgi:hypothetical protein